MSEKHLWEYDHPYYAQEGNYFSNDYHTVYESWADYMREWGDNDDDLNMIYRWDWYVPDPLDLEPGEEPQQFMQLYYILQRKAICSSVYVKVTEADEPEVRKWLERHAAHKRALWEPLLDEEGAA